MKKVRRYAAGALMGALFVGVLLPGSSAAAVQQVAVYSNFFTPTVREAIAGDSVEFVAQQPGHRIRAYRGGDFDSGDLDTNDRYSVDFGGGTIRYHCTIHSVVNSAGQCSGMCGIITDDPNLDLQVPFAAIVTPRGGAVVTPVPELEGTLIRNRVLIEVDASDNVRVDGVGVRLYDNAGKEIQVKEPCTTCGQKNVRWTARPHLLPGTYIAEAVAVDSSGNLYTSPRRTFVVL